MENVKPRSMFGLLGTFSFSLTDLQKYQEFSKDNNPVHKTGVVFGIQLMARIEGLIDRKLNFVTGKYTYYFLKKVMVDEEISVYLSDNQQFEVWSFNKKIGEGAFEHE